MTENHRARHDIRNHLGIILGFSEILIEKTPPGDPIRCDIEEIHKAATAAFELVEHVFREADTPP